MSVHTQGEPTGAACTLRIRPTTTPSASTSKSSSFHWLEGREAEARLRISEDTLRGHHISLGAPLPEVGSPPTPPVTALGAARANAVSAARRCLKAAVFLTIAHPDRRQCHNK